MINNSIKDYKFLKKVDKTWAAVAISSNKIIKTSNNLTELYKNTDNSKVVYINVNNLKTNFSPYTGV